MLPDDAPTPDAGGMRIARFVPGPVIALVAWSLLSGCGVQRAPQPEGSKQDSPAPKEAALKSWDDIPVGNPQDRVTIHYHRQHGDYDGVNLWTWDSYHKSSPKQNAITPIGRSDFGLVFQIDRANYGGSDRIGLAPRVGNDWSRKDGPDRFWASSLGAEVWMVSGSERVFKRRPDILAVYVDAPDRIVIYLTRPTSEGAGVTLQAERRPGTDDKPPEDRAVAEVKLNRENPLELEITPVEPLDLANFLYRIRVEGFGDAVALLPRGMLDDRKSFYDGDAPLGAIHSPQSTVFRLFAPTANSVSVVLYDRAAGEEGRTVRPLSPQPKGLWGGRVDGDLAGKYYTFLLHDPELGRGVEVLDPYAVNAAASSTRGRIVPLKPAESQGPSVASPTDMVVYEMHVRDFTMSPNSGVQKRGLYLGWTEAGTRLAGDAHLSTAIDHLAELGVTHVQLLPVHDFENDEVAGRYNWGYVTTAFFSPEGLYATDPANDSRVTEFKALVQTLHSRDIGVILDVVYNHTSSSAPFFAIAPQYYYRHLQDGSLANGSACGIEIRSEAPMVRRLIIDSLKFWVQEYGVDGFRFDLMGLMDRETMRQAEIELRAINSDIVLYGEPWTASATPLVEKTDKPAMRSMQPLGAFNDDFRNALKGSPDGASPGWIQNGSNLESLKAALRVNEWLGSPAQSMNYMTCHDNLVLWDKLKLSMPHATEKELIDTMKLGYLALFTAQGVPFIHGGEEFARTKGGNHNSYDAADSVNQVDWSLKRKHHDLFEYTRELIALRKAHPVFRLRTREEVQNRLKFEATPNEKTLLFTVDGTGVPGESWKRVCVVMNSDRNPAQDFNLPPGRWLIAMDERGATPGPGREISGKLNVPAKSGYVLYQR